MLGQTLANRLDTFGNVLPRASKAKPKYASFVKVNGLLFISGKGPAGNPTGKLGSDFTTKEGYEFARQTAIEVVEILKSALGSLDKVKRIVKIQGYVNADPTFKEHHIVLNGYYDLLLDVFGEKGIDARTVFVAVSARDNLPIIVDSIFEVEELD